MPTIKSEADWLQGKNPDEMIAFLQVHSPARLSQRVCRLFACNCVRQRWDLLGEQESRDAVLVTENYLDGKATLKEWREASYSANEAQAEMVDLLRSPADAAIRERDFEGFLRKNATEAALAEAAYFATVDSDLEAASRASTSVATALAEQMWQMTDESIQDSVNHVEKQQATILHDLVGNPFLPAFAWNPLWHTKTVATLATAAYESVRDDGTLDSVRLLVLSDALEEAGCTEEMILMHLRAAQGGVQKKHYRGCHVLDFLREKTLPNETPSGTLQAATTATTATTAVGVAS